ncbi:hypothetical protein ACFL6Y_05150 [Elusimicrobiota bacterium]
METTQTIVGNYVTYGSFVLLCAIISGKWAMELECGQFRQVLWGMGALLLGPLIPLVLYVRMLYKKSK